MAKIHKLNKLSERMYEKEKERVKAQLELCEKYKSHIGEIEKEISEISKPFNVKYKNSKNQIFIESFYQTTSHSLGLNIKDIWNNTTVDDVMKYCIVYESYVLANQGDIERMPSEDEVKLIMEKWKDKVLEVIKNER
jgi:hypothetical protein